MKPCAVIVPVVGPIDGERRHALMLVLRNLGVLELHLQPDHDWLFTLQGASPAASRNAGAEAAIRGGHDVLLFNDADTLVPFAQMIEAVELARADPGLVFAFRTYHRLSEAVTAGLEGPAEAFAAPVAEALFAPPSHGCIAISAAGFEQLGGYDERLETFEDCAFNQRARELGPLRRVAGEAVHLWHHRLGDPGVPAWEERYADSRRLFERDYREGVEA